MSREQSTTFYHANLDTLIAAYEARPESKARASAWEFLSEASALQLDGDTLIVPSATWSGTTYKASPTSCTCPAHAKGRHCWHKEAATIVFAAQAEDVRYDAEADSAIWQAAYDASPAPYHAIAHHDASEAVRAARKERLARSLAAVNELFA